MRLNFAICFFTLEFGKVEDGKSKLEQKKELSQNLFSLIGNSEKWKAGTSQKNTYIHTISETKVDL